MTTVLLHLTRSTESLSNCDEYQTTTDEQSANKVNQSRMQHSAVTLSQVLSVISDNTKQMDKLDLLVLRF